MYACTDFVDLLSTMPRTESDSVLKENHGFCQIVLRGLGDTAGEVRDNCIILRNNLCLTKDL